MGDFLVGREYSPWFHLYLYERARHARREIAARLHAADRVLFFHSHHDKVPALVHQLQVAVHLNAHTDVLGTADRLAGGDYPPHMTTVILHNPDYIANTRDVCIGLLRRGYFVIVTAHPCKNDKYGRTPRARIACLSGLATVHVPIDQNDDDDHPGGARERYSARPRLARERAAAAGAAD